jgi:two-component system response regulator AtoC
VSTILVAEDELEVRNYLGVALKCLGYGVELAQNGEEVLRYMQAGQTPISLLMLDILMPEKDGLETLREVRQLRPDLPIIMLSGASSPSNIVTAMKWGATDFLPKPMSHDNLVRAIQKVLPRPMLPENSRQSNPVLAVRREPGPACAPVGAWRQKAETLIRKVGSSEVPVLLMGETGVGKEVIARKLHAKSPRANGPFLKLNCAALPAELVESELFGYDRGAFTGAFRSTPGKFEMADGGTILLDEIGDMDFKLQAKLLQVLQDREFLRLGAKETSKVDVRVMAATHCDLERAIQEGRFREDLYYRLNIIEIRIPPLRQRQDEILPLAEYFLRAHTAPGEPGLDMPAELRNALLEHHWPGNVRELENLMRRYLVLQNPEALVEELRRRGQVRIPASMEASNPIPITSSRRELETSTLHEVRNAHKAAEVDTILAALNAARWNRKQAAASLKIDYKALLYKMKKLGIGEKKVAALAS